MPCQSPIAVHHCQAVSTQDAEVAHQGQLIAYFDGPIGLLNAWLFSRRSSYILSGRDLLQKHQTSKVVVNKGPYNGGEVGGRTPSMTAYGMRASKGTPIVAVTNGPEEDLDGTRHFALASKAFSRGESMSCRR